MKWFAAYTLIIFFIAPGCDLRKREEFLQKKEAELNQKEQELLLKEKTLQLKDEELQKMQKPDSSANVDTMILYNPAIIGFWSVKMVCTEATCPGSAVGDTKTEQWNISYESNTIIAKAMSDDKLVRTYTGKPNADVIELTEQLADEGTQGSTSMIVRLRLINDNRIEGQREIVRDNNCKVVYSLQMEKQK
jgi:hypothetical protein